jgi:phosphohistidine phosphatase
MELFVLRHGQAELQKTTDDARNLTDKGRADVACSIRYALPELKNLREIWASPLVRAQQTATIARDLLAAEGIDVAIRTSSLIVPEADTQQALNALQGANSPSILFASHLPFVGDFIDQFCGSASGFHSMDTSSLACIDYEIAALGLGRLRWLRHAND